MKWQPAKKQSPLSRVRAHKLLALLIFIVVLITGIFVYEKIALELNRRAFAHARSAIDALYADIIAQVGPPDNFKRSNSCSRPNLTFIQGPLSCDVGTTFIYGVEDINQANIILKETQTIIKENGKIKATKKLSQGITSAPVIDAIYSSATDYYSNNGMECISSYWFDTPRQIELSIVDKTKKSLEISISCNNWARAQYYPKS